MKIWRGKRRRGGRRRGDLRMRATTARREERKILVWGGRKGPASGWIQPAL